HGHLLQLNAHGLGGVASQVLVGEEQDSASTFKGPLQYGGGIRGSAHQSPVASNESFEFSRAVHVSHRDDRHPSVVFFILVQRGEFFPALLDAGAIGHICHGAAGCQVGQDDRLVFTAEDIGGFGHEVHTAEDNGFCLVAGQCRIGQLEGIPHEVGVL